MFESAKVKEKELVKSAEKVAVQLTKRLQVIQQSVLGLLGWPARIEVEEAIAESEKLARRLDKLGAQWSGQLQKEEP